MRKSLGISSSRENQGILLEMVLIGIHKFENRDCMNNRELKVKLNLAINVIANEQKNRTHNDNFR